MTYFHHFFQTIPGVLGKLLLNFPNSSKDTRNCLEKVKKISHLKSNQLAPSIYIMKELCFFSLDQWEISIHLLWGKCFNIPHHCDPHLNQTKLNGLLPLTIPGVLVAKLDIFCKKDTSTWHNNYAQEIFLRTSALSITVLFDNADCVVCDDAISCKWLFFAILSNQCWMIARFAKYVRDACPAPAPGKMAALARPSPENFQDCPALKMPRV